MATQLCFDVAGLTCADCAVKLETCLRDLPGTESVAIGVAIGTATVTARLDVGRDSERDFVNAAVKAAAPLGFFLTQRARDGVATLLVDVAVDAARTCWPCLTQRSDVAESTVDDAVAALTSIPGVVDVKRVSEHGSAVAVRVHYDPRLVGARDVLRSHTLLRLCAHPQVDVNAGSIRLGGAVALAVVAVVLNYALPVAVRAYDEPFAGCISPRVICMCFCASIAEVVYGVPLARAAAAAAWHARTLTMDTLVTISSGVSFVYAWVLALGSLHTQAFARMGDPPFEAAALLLALVAVGREIEAAARRQTQAAMHSLARLQEVDACLVRATPALRTAVSCTTSCCDEGACASACTPACSATASCSGAAACGALPAPASTCTKPCSGTDGAPVVSSCATACTAPICSTAAAESVCVSVSAVEERRQLPPLLLHLNDIVEVGPGQRFPSDGVIVHGVTSVDESIVTGETVPVRKEVGASVIGGTTNADGLVHVRVTALPGMGTVSRIIHLIEDAQAERPRIQSLADQLSQWFTPFILVSGIVVFVAWLAAAHTVRLNTDGLSPEAFAMQFALSLIVCSCPCAVGLAVPTVVMVATTIAARHGLLLKSGAALETLSRMKHVVFDKTGTLTAGTFTVAKVTVRNAAVTKATARLLHAGARTLSVDDCLAVVASAMAAGSSHPLSIALQQHARTKGLPQPSAAMQCTLVAGQGLRAELGDIELLLGSPAFLASQGIDGTATLQAGVAPAASLVAVACDGQLLGMIQLLDTVRPDASGVVAWLHQRGVQCWIASGDRDAAVFATADAVGIPRERAKHGLSPEDKARFVRELQEGGKHHVTMAGDGINDAIALTAADVSVALGAGTSIAMDCADVVVKSQGLASIVTLFRLADAARAAIYRNFAWAAIYNVLAMPLAAGVLYPVSGRVTIPPAFAGLSELFSSVPVVLGSLLLYRFRKQPADFLSKIALQDAVVNDERANTSLLATAATQYGSVQ